MISDPLNDCLTRVTSGTCREVFLPVRWLVCAIWAMVAPWTLLLSSWAGARCGAICARVSCACWCWPWPWPWPPW